MPLSACGVAQSKPKVPFAFMPPSTGVGSSRTTEAPDRAQVPGPVDVAKVLQDYKGRPGYRGAQRIPDDAFYRHVVTGMRNGVLTLRRRPG